MFFVTFTICCVHHLEPAVPPQDVSGRPLSHDSILVEWRPPPIDSQNGAILGYKVLYVENEDGKTEVDAKSLEVTETRAELTNLQIYVEYKIWVLAFTSAGDSPMSSEIVIRTMESGRYSGDDDAIILYTPIPTHTSI